MKKKFDIPINLKIIADTENDAIYTALQTLKKAVQVLEMETVIVDYDLFEFVPHKQNTGCTSSRPNSCGCGNNGCC